MGIKGTPLVHSPICFGWKKVKTCHFASTNMFLPSTFAQDGEVGKRHCKA